MLFLLLPACSSGENSEARTLLPSNSAYVSVDERSILLANATIYIGDGGEPVKRVSILIVDDKIAAIGDRRSMTVPPKTRVIDLEGHTIIPGLIGMHNHTHMPGISLMPYTSPRLYLGGGVTTIATAGSADAMGELNLALAIKNGQVPGPTIYSSAPYITGPNGNAVMFKPEDESSAREFVQEWATKGVSWIKLYRHTDPKIAAIVIDEAHRNGLKVSGHLCSITFKQAATMGIDSLEHGLNAATDFVVDKPYGECVPSRASKLDLDIESEQVKLLIDALVENDVTLTSTLAILESGFPHRPQADQRSLKAMAKVQLEQYKLRQNQLHQNKNTTSTSEYWNKLLDFEKRFVARGGRLVAGPDNGRHVLPGYGDQRNFELLVESGVSIAQTIQIMTSNGAEVLGIDDQVGKIKEGYQADLVVLKGDLDSDPSVIRNTHLVFKNGVGYDPARLISDVDGQVGLH